MAENHKIPSYPKPRYLHVKRDMDLIVVCDWLWHEFEFRQGQTGAKRKLPVTPEPRHTASWPLYFDCNYLGHVVLCTIIMLLQFLRSCQFESADLRICKLIQIAHPDFFCPGKKGGRVAEVSEAGPAFR